MSNLAARVLSALVALPLVAALILWREPLGFSVLVILIVALALAEYAAITLPTGSRALRVGLVLIGVGLAAGVILAPKASLVWAVAAFMAAAFLVLLEPGEIPGAGGRLGMAVFGVFYLGALAPALALLQRQGEHGRAWVLLSIAVTFGNDTGAYFAGRGFGRHKLYPTVSPGKTVEGAIGGLVASVAAMFLARASLAPWLTIVDCLAVALPAAVLGPIGDLVESLIKRAAGVKDSGKLIPGHGGVLDRIDALLFVAAWIYIYVAHLR